MTLTVKDMVIALLLVFCVILIVDRVQLGGQISYAQDHCVTSTETDRTLRLVERVTGIAELCVQTKQAGSQILFNTLLDGGLDDGKVRNEVAGAGPGVRRP